MSCILGSSSSLVKVMRMCPALTIKNWKNYSPLLAAGSVTGNILVFDVASGKWSHWLLFSQLYTIYFIRYSGCILGCPQKHTFSNFDVRAFSVSELDISKQLLLLPFLFYLLHKNIIELKILTSPLYRRKNKLHLRSKCILHKTVPIFFISSKSLY